MTTTYIYVPFPVTPPKNPCGTCGGQGVTGDLYEAETGGGKTLLVDEFCPDCHGCGGADHRSCEGAAHAHYDPHADGPWNPADIDDDTHDDPGPGCPDCEHREWHAIEAYADDRVSTLRMPCGCASDRAEEVQADPEGGYTRQTPDTTSEQEAPAELVDWMKKLMELEQAGERTTIAIGPYTAITMIGALQIATRHPSMHGLGVTVLRDVVDQFKPLFKDTPGEDIIKRGEHPEFDQ